MNRTELYRQRGWNWSKKYSKCIKCGTSDSPHGGHGVCNRCRANKYYADNKEHCKDIARIRDRKRRDLVLRQYGSLCNCCGESTYEFLSIDHINGGGYKHRKEIGNYFGRNFYKWLVKNEFPEGFQVLCHNCNLAKGFYGRCPHEKRKQG
jgi:hypothetical protein